MKKSNIFESALQSVPENIRQQVNMSYDIADKIVAAMDEQHISKSKLAALTGATENEVASWIGGGHNFNLSTLSLISTALHRPLVTI